MGANTHNIDSRYEMFYAKNTRLTVYPTEFVVRTFLANYPGLNFRKPVKGDRILDVAFGDGRNTSFLCDLGLAVSGIEITQRIVDLARDRLSKLGYTAELRVGRNSHIPFEDDWFDYILACHCCYYCDPGETLEDNLAEYARVIKKGGYLVASVAAKSSYIFKDAHEMGDGSLIINSDPYGNRNGYRLHAFSQSDALTAYFSKLFSNFSLGFADNDYYGIEERVFWVVCQRN
jgi:ubiquinone/menaquinone biosynthesis C-methylase UbiE